MEQERGIYVLILQIQGRAERKLRTLLSLLLLQIRTDQISLFSNTEKRKFLNDINLLSSLALNVSRSLGPYFSDSNPSYKSKSILLNLLYRLVFILIGYGDSIRQIMLNLWDLGMITPKYAYFTFDIAPENCKGNDGRDQEACKAFEGIMDMANYIPTNQEYRKFEENVRTRMPEFAGLGYHMASDDEVKSVVFVNALKLFSP